MMTLMDMEDVFKPSETVTQDITKTENDTVQVSSSGTMAISTVDNGSITINMVEASSTIMRAVKPSLVTSTKAK